MSLLCFSQNLSVSLVTEKYDFLYGYCDVESAYFAAYAFVTQPFQCDNTFMKPWSCNARLE